ncbi:MAG TPA: FAD-dependent oxidoreductase [Steroidobacteraceae bacterium]|nr:FAD-dependent oxidoreductase [Steroidobacteraceae bacterium]
MRWSSTDPSPPLRIAIVGGGIASFVAGITLRERLPHAAITLYSAADEKMIGGQLASWSEQGYPVEHGLHALFGFYDHILPILKKVGAHENLTRSKEHIFVHERGAIHRFDLRTWPATYRGFTTAQKVRLLAAAPAITKLVLDVKRKGMGVLDAYDPCDLRALARKHGVPESVLQSGFFRQFYEAAFNAPSELSAAVAIESIYKIFSKRWHYYFNLPTTASIIAPLRRHFTDGCRGRIELNQKLTRVRTDDAGTRVVGLDFENQATGGRVSVEADEYVLALGLEDFKQLDFGAIASQHDYFRNVHKLQTVSSFSIQAWFRDDPVPQGIDSMVTGMPAPFGILCPITRVRTTRPPEDLPLRHEIIATGPERGYEDIPDPVIKAGFIKGLRDAGFRIPDDPADMHVVLRRNREPLHRYLLTRPGELPLRPPHQSPLTNLCLAGAWVRNEFALPCVEAAAEGAIKVAGLIAARALGSPQGVEARRFAGVPRSAPLVLPPPYCFPRSTASVFLLDANPERLAEVISPDLRLFPGLGGRMLFAALRHEDVHARCDPSGARYSYNEVLLAAFVRERGVNPIGRMGLYPICLYVDDDTAMAAGREVYGFPKKMARIELSAHEMSLVRRGLSPEAASASVHPIKVMSAHWVDSPRAAAAPFEAPGRASPAAKTKRSFVLPLFGDLARLMTFYNTRQVTQTGARSGVSSILSQLTKVALGNVQVRRVSPLSDFCLRVGASINDPIYLLMRPDCDEAEIHASRGVQVEFAFSMGSAHIVGAIPEARDTQVLGRMTA